MLKERLVEHFSRIKGSPFLFVGSGLSRRYLGLPNWVGLLSEFCDGLSSFQYYLSSSDGNVPAAAELLANDFHDLWWSHERFAESRAKYSDSIVNRSSALRHEICSYLESAAINLDSKYEDELPLLKELNVDGVITTNWDCFLEQMLPEYRVYVGQDELLFSNPQGIAEIYKIHGCMTDAKSLVLTQSDYALFEEKNPYLAAKLITLFVEHPIVFLGYSLTDPNIQSLVGAIARCLGQDKLDSLRDNLIFVTWDKNCLEGEYSNTTMTVDDRQLPVTLVKSDSFVPVYEAIGETKRSIPARVLRYCKEQLFEIVQTNDPTGKIAAIGYENIDDASDIEFVVGVGVLQKLGQKGYAALSTAEVFEHYFGEEEGDLDAEPFLTCLLPTATVKFMPVFKYLRKVGVRSLKDFEQSEFQDVSKFVNIKMDECRLPGFKSIYESECQDKTTKEIADFYESSMAVGLIASQPVGEINLEAVFDFLQRNSDKFQSGSISTPFRKLACLYDQLKYGWAQEDQYLF